MSIVFVVCRPSLSSNSMGKYLMPYIFFYMYECLLECIYVHSVHVESKEGFRFLELMLHMIVSCHAGSRSQKLGILQNEQANFTCWVVPPNSRFCMFLDKVSLWCSGWPGTHYVDKVSLKLTIGNPPCASMLDTHSSDIF